MDPNTDEKVDLDDACFVLAVSELPAFEDMQQLVTKIRTTLQTGTNVETVQSVLKLALSIPGDNQALTHHLLDVLVDSIARET